MKSLKKEIANQVKCFKTNFFLKLPSELENERLHRQNDENLTEIANLKKRLDSKELEVQKLYKQILDQDQTFAQSYRLQEESFRYEILNTFKILKNGPILRVKLRIGLAF